MKLWNWIAALALTFGSLSALAQASSEAKELPASLQAALSEVPGQQLTLDFVVGWAVLRSDGFKLVQAPLIGKEVPVLRAAELLDWRLSANTQYNLIEAEVVTFFAPEKQEYVSFGLGLKKAFTTGTLLDLNYDSTRRDVTYSAALQNFGSDIPREPYSDHVFSMNISQELWQNGFGRTTRRQLKAADMQEDIIEWQVEAQVGEWATGIINTYYQAWLAKQKLEADRANLERQQRLLNITNVQAQRGTVEEQDVIQIRAARELVKNEMITSEQRLRDIWRNLVLLLNAPKEWLDANPYHIPLDIDNPVPFANRACGEPGQIQAPPEENARLRALRAELKKNELSLEAARDQFNPSLSLNVGVGANGIEPNYARAFEDVRRFENPSTSVGLNFELPLSRTGAKAAFGEALTQKTTSELQMRQGVSEHQAQWLNACNNLFQLIRRRNAMNDLVGLQQRRARLEEQQFRIGRGPAIEVIQAGQDMTQARVLRSQITAELHQTAWRIRDLAGDIPEYLSQLSLPGEN